jgi:hypothetical protein
MKKRRGRPTAYKAEYVEQAHKFCLLGADNARLAQLFGVAVPTIDKWIKEKPDFSCAVKEGRDIADANVGKSLYQRALGYEHKEEKIFLHEGQPVVVETVKHYPPDTRAAEFWLKNRQRDKWREKQEIEHSGSIQRMSDDELDAEIQRLLDAK